MNPAWEAYAKRWPERASWLVRQLEMVRQCETCVGQFPEACCDITAGGIEYEAELANPPVPIVAVSGQLLYRAADEDKAALSILHAWNYDVDAKLYLDLTAHQLPRLDAVMKDSTPKILVVRPEDLATLGYALHAKSDPMPGDRVGATYGDIIEDGRRDYREERQKRIRVQM